MRQWLSGLCCGLVLFAPAAAAADNTLRAYLESAQGAAEQAATRAALQRVADLLEAPAEVPGTRMCGSALWPAVSNLQNMLSASGREALSAAAASLLARPTLDTFYDVPQVPVRVHYSVTGSSAVRGGTTDTLADGVPRYVHTAADAYVRAWEVLVDSLGFLPPLSDSGLGGGTSRLDCYLAQTPYAGFTASEFGYGRIVGSDTIVAASTYMVVHPTMSGFNITVDPFDYLRITCAHEFFHTIHFAYDAEEKPNWQTYSFWLEGNAVWFEDYAFPAVDDWEYLSAYFNAPERSLTYSATPGSVRPYGAGSLWTFYLVERFGGPSILHDIWNRCGLKSGDNTLSAIDSVLGTRGSSLDEAWHEFATWCAQTGSRANAASFVQGALWPQVQPTSVLFSYPAAVHFTDGSDGLEGDVDAQTPVATIGPTDTPVGALGFAALAHVPFPTTRPDSLQRLYVQSLPALPAHFSYVGKDITGSGAVNVGDLALGDTTLVPAWITSDTLFVLASCGLHYDAGSTPPDDPPSAVSPLLSVALDSAGAGISAIVFSDPYPNPMVHPADLGVNFTVGVPGSANVFLDVFTLSGDRVKSLSQHASVWPPASLVWDGRNEAGSDVASGLYLCKLTVELEAGERQEKLYRVGVVR